jgi:hypothetical protein
MISSLVSPDFVSELLGQDTRFLRHFSKGEGDYLVIQEKLFKGMDLEQIYKKAKEHHRAK